MDGHFRPAQGRGLLTLFLHATAHRCTLPGSQTTPPPVEEPYACDVVLNAALDVTGFAEPIGTGPGERAVPPADDRVSAPDEATGTDLAGPGDVCAAGE